MIDEKVLLERLEETRWTTIFDTTCIFENDKLDKCIKIVNQLAEESKNKYVRTDEVGYMLDTIEMCGDETWMDYYHKALKGLCELSGKESNLTPCYLGSPCEYQNEDAKMPMEHWDNGWIPCSERLPEEYTSVLVLLNNEEMRVLTLENDFEDNKTMYWADWYGHYKKISETVAWMPLPAPYQPKDCNTCANNTDFDEVDNGCYMCCKGYENNYQPKE